MDDDRWDRWPEPWVGTDCDMRTVVGAIPREVKDGFKYDQIPWERFPHCYGPGEEIPGFLAILASGDADAARRALGNLWEYLHHQGNGIAVGALAVPFLLRIAAAGSPELRAETLQLVAEIARCQHFGDGRREGLLQVAEDPEVAEGTTMCPVDWTIQAARSAITADLHLLLSLLPNPDPEVRSATAFVLATATGEMARISSALDSRLAVEDDPTVRVSLILAIAQLAREDHNESVPAWTRALWSDAAQPLETRVGAALAWLCLVDDPVPDELRTLLTDPGTDQLGELFQQVPWLPPVDYYGNALRSCIDEMLTPDVPGKDACSPWA
ncbi:hypothetical protein ACFZDJ_24530 [Streptomyces sp. NPDC007896]|uniref:hypothetical protein n=1 Tax=Streptomyces sp. NPDC007896 TaxID=3364784 RepID=UPI0036ED3492